MKRTLLLVGFVFGIGCLVDAQERPGRNESNRPVGTWEQSNGDNTLTLTVTADRLHITATGKEKKSLCLVDADYSVTKDSILYGIVTSIENGGKMAVGSQEAHTAVGSTIPFVPALPTPPPSTSAESNISMALGLSVDDLFSFRFRADDDILTIKATKAKTAGGRGEFPLEGRFKKIPDSENRLQREKGDFEKKEAPKESYKLKTGKAKSAESHRQLTPPSQRVSVGELSLRYGNGQIMVRGEEFQAQAESITYDEQNNRLTFEGSKDTPVTFTILRANNPPQIFRGTKIVLSPRTGRIEAVDITSIRN